MDDNVIKIIMNFSKIKCHSCYNEIDNIIKLKELIKVGKFYYCNNACYMSI